MGESVEEMARVGAFQLGLKEAAGVRGRSGDLSCTLPFCAGKSRKADRGLVHGLPTHYLRHIGPSHGFSRI